MAISRLNLTRDQLATFLKDHEQIKQFERLFATVDAIAPDFVNEVAISAGTAQATANDALALIEALENSLTADGAVTDAKATLALQELQALKSELQLKALEPAEQYNNSIITDYLTINENGHGENAVGRMIWDDGEGTIDFGLKGGNVVCKIGVQEYVRAYNDTLLTMTKGQIVYISGAQGNRVAVKLAQADSDANSAHTIGLVAETIAAGGEGFVQVSGPIYKLNTLGTIPGDTVYLSPTIAGAFTTTKPLAPQHMVIVGFIERVHASVGSIFIKVDNGYELDELHNVRITSVQPNDLLQYDSGGPYWKNVAPSTISIGTATNLAGGAAGSVPYQTGAGATTFLPIGTATQVLKVNAGATAPEWVSGAALSKVDDTNVTLTLGGSPTTALLAASSLTLGWTGTLAVSRGGTGTGTALTPGSVVFAGASGVYSQDNANLFWDDATDRLGIGTATPAYKLDALSALGAAASARFTGYSGTAGSYNSQIRIASVNYVSGDLWAIGNAIATDDATRNFDIFDLVAGANRLRIDSSGKVGIGTASPGSMLDVVGSAAISTAVTTPIVIGGTGTTSTLSLRSTSGVGATGADIVLQVGNNGATEAMRITNAGNVGIRGTPITGAMLSLGTTGSVGSTSPVKLSLGGTFSTSAGLYPKLSIYDDGVNNYGFGVSASQFEFQTPTGTRYVWYINAVEQARISSAGNFLLGTTAALTSGVERMTVAGATVTDVSGAYPVTAVFADTRAYDSTAPSAGGGIGFGYKYNSAGASTIGSSIQGYKQNTTDGDFGAGLRILTRANGGQPAERMRIDSLGNVGIGTTSPTSKLTVDGTFNATGNVILGDATTDTVTVNGYMGVGIAPVPQIGVRVSSTTSGDVSQWGVTSNPTSSAGATYSIGAYFASPNTAASAFTTNNAYGYYANNPTKGAGSTITNLHGVYIVDQTQGTNNYGVTSLVSSGTNKWNIYASGTANNYFAGNVGIGTSSPALNLHVNGSGGTLGGISRMLGILYDTSITAGTGAALGFGTTPTNGGVNSWVHGAVSAVRNTSTDTDQAGGLAFFTRPSSGSLVERLRIDSSGNVGIGTSSPTNTLSVTGSANVTGNVILGDATTDTVTVNGYMGVGGAGSSDVGLKVVSTTLVGTAQFGIQAHPLGTSSATVAIDAINVRPQTAAATFTTNRTSGLTVLDAVKGAGSTITNQHGLYIADQTQGTNNYGITSLVSSGTNKWNIYASGTAQNYFAGNVGIGTTAPTSIGGGIATVEISGTSGGGVRFRRTTATTIDAYVSAITGEFTLGTISAVPVTLRTTNIERIRIDSAGNVGVGTATNLSTLTVNGSFASKSPSTVNAATYIVSATDGSLRFTTTNCTVTLPAAASFPGRILYLNTITANSVTSAASNVIPIGSDTAGTAILAATAGKFAMIQSNGTNWITMMAN